MNDDSTQAIEERLHALTPQPMDLDAAAVLAAAGRSADEDAVSVSRPLVTVYRQWLPLAAACVVGMLCGSMMTAFWMRSTTGSSTAAQQNDSSFIGSPPMDRDFPESEEMLRADESEPALIELATNDVDAAERIEDSSMTDDRTFNRNGLSYSLRQQRFLSTNNSFAAVDITADYDILPASGNAANGGASSRRSVEMPMLRRDRLMQELLRM